MSPVAEETAEYRGAFERLSAQRGQEPAGLSAARRAALERFERLGFPSTRDEDWKHTSVAPLIRETFERGPDAPVDAAALAPLTFGRAFEGHQIVFVNGRHVPALSSAAKEDGVVIASLRDVLAGQAQRVDAHVARVAKETVSSFASLNTALFEDGAVVLVPAGAVLREPVHVVFYSSRGGASHPTASHPRTLVVAGRGSEVSVVESYGGAPGEVYFTNAVSEVVAEDGAIVDHYKVQRESLAAFHVGTLAVRQERGSRFTSHSLALGGGLVRNDVVQAFAGEGGECVLNGLFMVGGSQHTDTHTLIDHAHPHCTSRELYKGVLDGGARGVFVGKILVRAGAQKTDAHQANKNLLLSREALVHSVPQLEIHADDVRCKHGSTTGQLDPAALFYLRSRGIGEQEARSLLTYAFASDMVSRVRVAAIREGLEGYLQEHLPSRLADVAEVAAR